MNVVIDTNVFVSSFFGGVPRKIIDLWKEGRIVLCVSRPILDEYFDVLGRLGMGDEEEIGELLTLFGKRFNLLYTSRTPVIKAVKSDPTDDKFIECAVALKADVIITGDKALGAVGDYAGIKILTPRKFLTSFTPD